MTRFGDKGTRDIFHGVNSAEARRTLPNLLWRVAQRHLDLLIRAASLQDLRTLPGNRLEKLKYDLQGQYSLRINDKYRLCFTWTPQGAYNIKITDYH